MNETSAVGHLTATTTQPEKSPTNIPVLPVVPEGSGLVGVVISAVGALLWLRRKTSRDNLEITKEQIGSDLVKTLLAERDKAMEQAHEAWKSRSSDAKQIGELTSKVEYLTKTNEALEVTVSKMRHEIANLTMIVQNLTGTPQV